MPDQPMGPEDYEKQFAASGGGGPEDYEKEFANGGGKIPPPTPAPRPGAAWNSKAPWYENVQDQMEDILPSITRNVGGMVTGAAHGVGNFLTEQLTRPPVTPASIAQDNAQLTKPLKEQLHDLPVVGPAMEGRYGQAVGDVATGALMGKMGMPGEADTTSSLPKLLNVRSVAEKNFLDSSKPLAEVINSPKGAGRFQDETLRDVMPIVAKEAKSYGDVGKIDSYDKLKAVVDSAYDKHVAQYHQYLDPAIARGAVIDRGAEGIPNAMIQAIPKNIQLDAPAVYQDLVEEARSHGTPVKVGDLDQVRQENNAMLRKFENATGTDKASIMKSQASTAMLKAEQAASKDALYRKIDPETGGKNVGEVNRRLGSLIETRNGLTDLNDRMIRQSDPTGIQKMGQNIRDLLHIGADPTSGLTSVALKRLMAEPDVNGKIAKAFSNYKGADLPDVPTPSWDLVSPDERQSIIRQQGINEQQLPKSRMDTDFRQQYKDLPVHQLMLKGSEPEVPYPTQRPLYKEGIVNPAQPKLPYGPRPGDLGKPLTPPLRTRPGPASGPVRSGLHWNGTHFVEDD
jgi:hypothetical protein